MNVVFVHDHKFRRINGALYSPGGLSDEVITRYTDIFGTLKIFGRILDEDTVKGNYSKIINSAVTILTGEELKSNIEKADAVIIRLPSINGYKAVHYAKKYRKPYLVEVVGCTLDAYWNYGLKGKVLALPAYCIMRRAVKSAPYAVYVTSRFLQRRYPCNGMTAAISDVALEDVHEDVLVKRIAKIEDRRTRVILGTAAAVDVPYKGQEYFIRAIPAIEKKLGILLEYQLAGAGDETRLMQVADECGISDHVVFKGTIPHAEIYNWLDSIDIYIQPSLLEGLSRALIEAMSRGLPCIASDVGGNPELLEESCLFKLNEIGQISNRICDCISELLNEDIMREQSKRNSEYVNKHFQNEVLDESRTEFYSTYLDDIMKKSGGGVLNNLDYVLMMRNDRIHGLFERCANTNRIVIGTAAAVDVPYKGQEYVISAIKTIAEMHDVRIDYHVAGAGDQARLRQIAEEYGVQKHLILEGTIPHIDMFKWFDTLDIYIQPSLQEGLSRALIEAMSRGLPCIATNVGGNSELINKDYIVQSSNKRRIADAIVCRIERLLDLGKMKEQSIRNYNHSESQFGQHMLEEKREKFYKTFKMSITTHQNHKH